MKYSVKSLLIFIACCSVAMGLWKVFSATKLSGPVDNVAALIVVIPRASPCGTLFGLGLGAVLDCPWKGMFIGFAVTVAIILMLGLMPFKFSYD